MTRIFLHGLESSSKGAKATFLSDLYPDMLIPDFKGNLSTRMGALESILVEKESIMIIGSSFGGLMATLYTMEKQETVVRLILLAPVPTRMIIGCDDNITPPQEVLPLARKIFTNLDYEEVDDTHILGATFRKFDWQKLLAE
jgi:pimeloyl-ACP methyl ester carboxylesterase